MSEKLLPCPFCEADLEHSEPLSTRRFKAFVHPRDFDRHCVAESIIISETPSMERVKAWNRRTPAPEGVFVSETCEGEACWCGKPAVRKVGEEFAYDEPNPARHKLTRYICAHHFAELMGPAGARSVGIAPVVPVGVRRETLLKAVRPVLDRHPMIDSSQSHKLDIQAGWVADAILAALRPTDTGEQ